MTSYKGIGRDERAWVNETELAALREHPTEYDRPASGHSGLPCCNLVVIICANLTLHG
jgi:hypothetical protein